MKISYKNKLLAEFVINKNQRLSAYDIMQIAGLGYTKRIMELRADWLNICNEIISHNWKKHSYYCYSTNRQKKLLNFRNLKKKYEKQRS